MTETLSYVHHIVIMMVVESVHTIPRPGRYASGSIALRWSRFHSVGARCLWQPIRDVRDIPCAKNNVSCALKWHGFMVLALSDYGEAHSVGAGLIAWDPNLVLSQGRLLEYFTCL